MPNPVIHLPPDRHVGILFTAIFIVIAFWPLIFGSGQLRIWALVLGLAFFVIAFFRPKALNPLNRAWMAFGLLLSRIINPIVLGILFFLVITPVALVTRLFGRDTLKLKLEPEAKSYWVDRDADAFKSGSMKDQF